MQQALTDREKQRIGAQVVGWGYKQTGMPP